MLGVFRELCRARAGVSVPELPDRSSRDKPCGPLFAVVNGDINRGAVRIK